MAIGVAVPWVAIRLELTRLFAAAVQYQAINAVAIGLLVFALAKASHGNLFLAAFAAGITVATIVKQEKEAFHEFGELVAELLKLAALLVFGALISPAFLGEIPWTGWVFAVLAMVLARPVALWVSFLGSGLETREQAAAMWFGPKGFASVVYGLIVLASGIAAADEIFHRVALTIIVSIVAHSSTDVLVARRIADWHLRLPAGGRVPRARLHGGVTKDLTGPLPAASPPSTTAPGCACTASTPP